MTNNLSTNSFYHQQFTSDDLDNVYNGLSIPSVIEYCSKSFICKEETKEQIKWFAKLEENDTCIWWVICTKDTKEFVGAEGLYEIHMNYKKAEIGLWLPRKYWQQDITSFVMPTIVDYEFSQLELHRIEGFVENET